MGSDRDKDSNAFDFEFWPGGLQGTVTLPDFYIGKTEVTAGRSRSCVTANRCTEDAVAPCCPWKSAVEARGLCHVARSDSVLRVARGRVDSIRADAARTESTAGRRMEHHVTEPARVKRF